MKKKMKWEVVQEVNQEDNGNLVYKRFVGSEFPSKVEAERALWFRCVDFEYDGTPYTKLKRISGDPLNKNTEDKYQQMIGEDRSYGYGKHFDRFIHVRIVK